jgi:hypothetical protein
LRSKIEGFHSLRLFLPPDGAHLAGLFSHMETMGLSGKHYVLISLYRYLGDLGDN